MFVILLSDTFSDKWPVCGQYLFNSVVINLVFFKFNIYLTFSFVVFVLARIHTNAIIKNYRHKQIHLHTYIHSSKTCDFYALNVLYICTVIVRVFSFIVDTIV